MITEASRRSGVVAVTGAGGKTGRAIAGALSRRGVTVRAVVRRQLSQGDHLAETAEVVIADLRDPDRMRAALADVAAVYLIAPNLVDDEPAMMAQAIAAAARGGARRIVYHSVMHPFAPTMPHHLDKARVESTLHDSDLDWTIVQPASYFENALGVMDDILTRGVWPVPYPPSARFTPVALADVADVAALVLTQDGHRYATYELAGPQELSTDEMAQIAGVILTRAVTAQHVPAAGSTPPRLRMMFDHYAAAGFRGSSAALTRLLGRSPTDWETWLRAALQRHS